MGGTASDRHLMERIERAERENVRFAQLWRELTSPASNVNRRGSHVEELRLTAKAALEDWWEARG